MKVRRPAALGAAAFVVGTVAGLRWFEAYHLGWWAGVAFFLLSLLPLGYRVRLLLRLTVALILGWCLAVPAGMRVAEAGTLLRQRAACAGVVVVHGDVVGTVRERTAARGQTCYRFVITNLMVEEEGRELPLTRTALAVNWYGPPRSAGGAEEIPAVGQRWRFKGKIVPLRRRGATGGSRSSIELLLITRIRDSMRHAAAETSWRAMLERGRRQAALRLSHSIEKHDDDVALIHAMMLGYRSSMPRYLSRAFRISGTIHIFAISGLHVVAIATLLSFAVARLGVPRNLWIVPLAPMLIIYVVATGSQPSAMRAGLMSLLYLLAPFLGRRPDSLSVLASSAVILLLMNPLQLHNIGFIMSFVMVLGLVVMASPMLRWARKLSHLEAIEAGLELRARLGGELAQHVWRLRLQRRAVRIAGWLVDLFAVSLTAWLISVPLTSTLFGFFPVYSMAANLCVVPLSTFTMTMGSVSLALGSLSLRLSGICNRMMWLSTAAMRNVATRVAAWPGAAVEYTMPLLLALCWYVVLLLLVWWLQSAQRRRERESAAWLQEVLDGAGGKSMANKRTELPAVAGERDARE